MSWEDELAVFTELETPEQKVEKYKNLKNALGIAAAAVPRTVVTGLPDLLSSAENLGTAAVDWYRGMPFTEALARNRYAKGGYENVVSDIENFQRRYREANPGADDSALQKATDEYTSSDAYRAIEKQNLPVVRRYIETVGEKIDHTLGAPADYEKTNAEHVLAAGTSALTPTGFIKSAIGSLSPALKAATNTPIGSVATEIAIPGVAGKYTAGKATAGAGISSGLTAGINTAVDSSLEDDTSEQQIASAQPAPAYDTTPTMIDLNSLPADVVFSTPIPVNTAPQTDDEEKSVDEHASENASFAKNAGITAMFGMAALGARHGSGARRVINQATATAAKLRPGPAMSNAPKPASLGGAFDELSPVHDALRQAGASEEKAFETVTVASEHRRHNVAADFDQLYTTGRLDALGRETVPLQDIERMSNMLRDAGKWETAEAYMFGKTINDTRVFKLQKAEEEARAAFIKAREYEAKGKTTEAREQYALQAKAQQTVDEMKNDVEAARPSMRHWTNADIQKMVADGAADPDIVKFEQAARQAFDDLLEYKYKAGLYSKDEVDTISAANPNYIFTYEDLHQGKSGAARLWSKVKDKFRDTEASRGQVDFASPQRQLNSDKPIANLPDLMDSLRTYAQLSVQAVNKQQQAKTVINELLRQPDWHKVMTRYTTPQGQFEFTPSHFNKIMHEAGGLEDYNVHIFNNGKITAYKFHDPNVATSLIALPMFSHPLASALRQSSNVFRFMTTREGNPMFALKNFVWESNVSALTRPRDRVSGADYAMRRGLGALGVSPDSAISKAVGHVGRAAAPVDLALTQMLNLGSMLEVTLRQFQGQLAQAIKSDLTTSSGIFNIIAKSPAGGQWLERIADTMHKSFNESLYGTLIHNHALSSPITIQTARAINEADKLFNLRMSQGMSTAMFPVFGAWQTYKMLLNSMHSAAKYGYAARNHSMLALKYGGADKIPKREIEKLARETRVTSGDFARAPKDKMVQMAEAGIPFFRAMTQSTFNIWRAAKRDPYVAAMMVNGVAMPALYTGYLMNNWDEAAAEYYNNLPAFKRVAINIIPTAETLWDWASGKKVPYTREATHEIEVAPELRPVMAAFMTGAHSLGVFGDTTMGGAAQQSPVGDLGEAFGAAFGIMLPPVADAAMKMAGINFNSSRVFKLENPFEAKPPGDVSGARDTLSYSSNINKNVADAISSLLGAGSGRLLQAYDLGQRVYEDDGRFADAVKAASKQFAKQTFERRVDIVADPLTNKAADSVAGPFALKAAEKVYKRTPVSEAVYKKRSAIRVVTKPVEGILKPIGDPVLDPIAAAVRRMDKHNYEYKAYKKGVKAINADIAAIDNDRTLSYDERVAMKNKKLKDLAGLNLNASKLLNDFENQLNDVYGEQYKKAFGKPFTLEDFGERMKKAGRQKKSAESTRLLGAMK